MSSADGDSAPDPSDADAQVESVELAAAEDVSDGPPSQEHADNGASGDADEIGASDGSAEAEKVAEEESVSQEEEAEVQEAEASGDGGEEGSGEASGDDGEEGSGEASGDAGGEEESDAGGQPAPSSVADESAAIHAAAPTADAEVSAGEPDATEESDAGKESQEGEQVPPTEDARETESAQADLSGDATEEGVEGTDSSTAECRSVAETVDEGEEDTRANGGDEAEASTSDSEARSTRSDEQIDGASSTEHLPSRDMVKEKDTMHLGGGDREESLFNAVAELTKQVREELPSLESLDNPLACEGAEDCMRLGDMISAYSKKVKALYLRKKKQEASTESKQWSSPQIVYVYRQLNELAVCKLQQSVRASGHPLLNACLLRYPDLSPSLVPACGLEEPSYGAGASTTEDEGEAASSASGASGQSVCALELAFLWSRAAVRYGKSLERQKRIAQAFSHFTLGAKLNQFIIEEDHERAWTARVFQKFPKVLERLSVVRPSDSALRTYCDSFLIHFSNIAMRGEISDLSLKPLIALCLSENRYIRESKPVDVVRHLAAFFETPLANEASRQLEYLESILKRTVDKEAELERLLTDKAKLRLKESGLTKEEIMEHTEVIINLLSWKGKPPSRLTFDPVPLDPGQEPDADLVWILENPRRVFVDRYKLSAEEDGNPDANVYLAKRKSDGMPVAIKVIKRYSVHAEAIKRELAWLQSLRHEVFAHMFEVYLFNDEVWAVMEYCSAGNLVDLLPAKPMTEDIIAYIVRELLRGLAYLHARGRMHRDLTSDDVLVNLDGEVMLVDFEIWLDAASQRYWLSPELLLMEPYPYGPEVDIWSLGCIVIEMAEGRPPYSDLHPLKEFFFTATRGAPKLRHPNKWSPAFKSFLEDALNPDPNQRATAQQLLSHPFVRAAATREDFAKAIQYRVSFTKW